MCPHCKNKDAKIVKRDYLDGRPSDWACHACGKAVKGYQPEIKGLTTEATEIGMLYRQAKSSFVDSVKVLLECGHHLRAQKEKLEHGEWLPWLEANKEELGFGERTARYLMDAASRPFSINRNPSSEIEALAISRQIWGNREPEPVHLSEPEPSENATPSIFSSGDGSINRTGAFKRTEESPKPVKPPALKPIMDLPPPPKLDSMDNNPRTCRASCCPGGSEIMGPWARHDAQALFDQSKFPHGHFGKDHGTLLRLFVEIYHRHVLDQLDGRMTPSATEFRERRYRGIGQGRN